MLGPHTHSLLYFLEGVIGDTRYGFRRATMRMLACSKEAAPHHVCRTAARAVKVTIHPIVYVVARQPQLLAVHMKAYGDLLLEEGRRTISSLVLHAALYAAAAVFGAAGILSSAVALLLYAAIVGELRHGWLLIALPCASMLAAGACVLLARALPLKVTLGVVGRQVKADIDMLHEAGRQ